MSINHESYIQYLLSLRMRSSGFWVTPVTSNLLDVLNRRLATVEHSVKISPRTLLVISDSTRGMILLSISVTLAVASSSYPNSIVLKTS